MSHPLLDSHPLLPLLAADLRARPGQLETDEGDPIRAAVAIVLRGTSQDIRHQASGISDHQASGISDAESRVTSFEQPDIRHQASGHGLESGVSLLEVLLIQRAERHGDPWSGQVALPGGRRDRSDATLQDTAVRETLEETGIDLSKHGLVLGTLDELRPRTPVLPPIIVTPFVAVVGNEAPITISDELASAFWVPWSTFADPARVDQSTVQVRGAAWQVSSYLVGERVVWGMTERMLRQLAERLQVFGTP